MGSELREVGWEGGGCDYIKATHDNGTALYFDCSSDTQHTRHVW